VFLREKLPGKAMEGSVAHARRRFISLGNFGATPSAALTRSARHAGASGGKIGKQARNSSSNFF
jgi:hypothetical protein